MINVKQLVPGVVGQTVKVNIVGGKVYWENESSYYVAAGRHGFGSVAGDHTAYKRGLEVQVNSADAFAAAGDVHGYTVRLRAQDGGVKAGVDTIGGTLVLQPGAKGSGSAGLDGTIEVRTPDDVMFAAFNHNDSVFELNGVIVLDGMLANPWTPVADKGSVWVKQPTSSSSSSSSSSSLAEATTLWFTDSLGVEHQLGVGGGGGTPGGSNEQLQYNNFSAFGGTADLTYNLASTTLNICTGLKVKASSAPAVFTAAAAPGTSVYLMTQRGAAGQIGANLILQTGDGNAGGGTNRRGYFNVTGVSAGAQTTFIGEDAGNLCTGAGNTFIGYRAGYLATTLIDATIIGTGAGAAALTSTRFTAIGARAGAVATGLNCTFIGHEAGIAVTTSNNCTFIGSQCGTNTLAANHNTYIGNQAGVSNVSGAGNTYVGQSAGYANLGAGTVCVGRGSCDGAGVTTLTTNNSVHVGNASGEFCGGDSNVNVGNSAGRGLSGSPANGVYAECVHIGYQAGLNSSYSGSAASFCVAVGSQALQGDGTAGGDNTLKGVNNIAIGYKALQAAIATPHSFNNCVAVGSQAGLVMSTGTANVFMGSNAGLACTSASYNVAIGTNALAAMTVDGGHTAIGDSAGATFTGNVYLTAIGAGALRSATTGGSTAIGGNALGNCTTGLGNVAVGNFSLRNITTEGSNTVVGSEAGYECRASGNTYLGAGSGHGVSGHVLTGNYNVGVGQDAMRSPNAVGAKAFTQCVGVGVSAGYSLISATGCVLIGYQAGYVITSGSDNCALGTTSGLALTSGTQNTLIGTSAGAAVTTGTGVVCIGHTAGLSCTGAPNTLVGHVSGAFLVSGTNNTLIGTGSNIPIAGTASSGVAVGDSAVTNSNSVAIGAGASTASAIDSIAIGRGAATATANTMVCGSGSYPITNVYFGKGVVSTAATAYTINGTGGSGSNNAGADLILATGIGTGTEVSGAWMVKQAPAVAGSSSTPNTLATVLQLTNTSQLLYASQATADVAARWYTASTEFSQVAFNAGVTHIWASGALTQQRTCRIEAETLAFSGASTVTTAATFYVSGAPGVGANCTITNAYAVWVDAGTTRLDGSLLHLYRVAPYTDASVTVNDYNSNSVYTNDGATAQVIFNLPTAVAGLTYTFIVQVGYTLRVLANTGDTIRLAATVSAAAGYCESATVGNVVKLVAINATEWIAVSLMGSWTVV